MGKINKKVFTLLSRALNDRSPGPNATISEERKRKRVHTTSSQMPQSLSNNGNPIVQAKSQLTGYVALELEQSEEQTAQRHDTSGGHETDSSGQIVSLLYNECSLIAISNWVAGSIAPLSSLPIDPGFRQCLVCQKWGHYESECTSETKERLQSQHADYGYTDEVQIGVQPVSHLYNRGEDSYVVVETCHGFDFEQRATYSRPDYDNDLLPEGYEAVSTVEIDGSLITSVRATNQGMSKSIRNQVDN
jgi:hypothetical protein